MLCRLRQRRRTLLKRKSVKTHTAVLPILGSVKRAGRPKRSEGLNPSRTHSLSWKFEHPKIWGAHMLCNALRALPQ